MGFRLFNYVGFQLGWAACIIGAARDMPWLGMLGVGLFLTLHLLLTPARRREVVLAMTLAGIGTFVESLHLAFGIFQADPNSLASWLCPTWLTLLWVNFAPTLHGSLRWLLGRWGWAAVLGALGGPVSYYAGEKLGAISFPPDAGTSLGILALVWGMAMPALFWLAGWADRRWGNTDPMRDERDKREKLER